MQARMGLPILWKVLWRKVMSLMKCALSRNGKAVKWMGSLFLKYESVSHLKNLVLDWKFS